MHPPVDRPKLEQILREFGRSVKGTGRVYLAGGSTAVWFGWRPQTVDVDYRFDPEPGDAYPVLRRLMDRLEFHSEPATPHDFLPPIPGWQERSVWIARHGEVDFYHYDLYSQALAKVTRGFDKDLSDAGQMVRSGDVEPARLLELFEVIRPELIRYPRLDEDSVFEQLTAFVSGFPGGTGG